MKSLGSAEHNFGITALDASELISNINFDVLSYFTHNTMSFSILTQLLIDNHLSHQMLCVCYLFLIICIILNELVKKTNFFLIVIFIFTVASVYFTK